MSEKPPEWAHALGAALVTGILATIALVAAGGWNWFAAMFASSWPAWVQAVGSIAAIFVAIFISKRQHERDVERATEARRESEVHALSVVASGLFYARAAVRCMEDKNGSTLPTFTGEMASLRHHMNALKVIPVLEIPDWFATAAIAEALTVCDRLEEKMKAFWEHFGADRWERAYDLIWKEINAAADNFQGFESILETTLQRRGAGLPHQTFRLNGRVIHTTDPDVVGELQEQMRRENADVDNLLHAASSIGTPAISR